MDLPLSDDVPLHLPVAPARYRVEALCGRGAAGSVYRAWDRELGRTVALKFLRDDRPAQRTRMLREARAQARIEHPHVCKIFDVVEEGDRLCIAMQWIDGERLDAVAAQLSLEEKIGILRDVAAAIHAGHAQGIIHRDVKPANVLVERRDGGALHPYVVDFGLARAMDEAGATATGEIIGTPHYLSPEQAWGLPVDRRSDVYSLGATLYELLSGAPPFAGDSSTDVLMQVLSRPARPLHRVVRSIPRDLSVIAGKCLEKEPEHRYDSARALSDDLQRWLSGDAILARPPAAAYRMRMFLRRHRAVAASIVLASLVIGGAAGYEIVALRNERAQRETAAQLEERVRYVERLLDHDRGLPLHDARPALRRARAEIVRLGDGIDAARFPAPLAYAVGRARLAADEIGPARDSLQRAWNGGLRTPAVAYSLAAALTGQYARDVRDAERIQDDGLRRARIAAIDGQYRAAVAPLLIVARQSAEQPAALVDAHIAFANGDDRRTIALADAVLARFPWNNEARLLQAEAHVRVARAKRRAGDVGGAAAAFARARKVYGDADVIAPSDARIGDGLCGIAAEEIEIGGPFSSQNGADDEHFARARTACERTLVADPDRVTALVALSSVWSLRKVHQQLEHEVGTAESREASALMNRALQLAPNDPSVLIEAGLTLWRAGVSHALEAIAVLRRAVAADPRSAEAHHSLGRALLLRHDEIEIFGDDSRAVLEEAIHENREAMRLAPSFIGAKNNLGIALNHLGHYIAQRGGDPEPVFREAIAATDSAIAQGPSLAEPHSVCAAAWIGIAEHRAATGHDASEAIAHAEQRITEAIELNPSYPGDWQSRAQLRMFEGRIARDAATRARMMQLAAEDLDHVDHANIGAGFARVEWCLLMAAQIGDRRYLDRALTMTDRTAARLPYRNGAVFLFRARIERARCRCDNAHIEALYRRALEITPALRADVEKARREW